MSGTYDSRPLNIYHHHSLNQPSSSLYISLHQHSMIPYCVFSHREKLVTCRRAIGPWPNTYIETCNSPTQDSWNFVFINIMWCSLLCGKYISYDAPKFFVIAAFTPWSDFPITRVASQAAARTNVCLGGTLHNFGPHNDYLRPHRDSGRPHYQSVVGVFFFVAKWHVTVVL